MKSYGQYCGLARALDVIGSRWSLLIVRELLIGPARYSQLREGLPGIATNLLTDRLRDFEQVGIVQRLLDDDSNGVLYCLTPWGAQLREPIAAMVKWSTPLMIPGPQGDSFRTNWLAVALDALLGEIRSSETRRVGLAVDDSVVTVVVSEHGTYVELDAADEPQTVFRGDPALVLGIASGMLTVEQAVAAGGVLKGEEADMAAAIGGRFLA